MALTPEQIKRRAVTQQEYEKLRDDEAFEDMFHLLGYYSSCNAGYGPREGGSMEDQEIVEAYADMVAWNKPFFTNAIPQGYQLLAMTPFLWKGIGMRASLLWPRGYNETQVREWLADMLKLLEAEAKKRGWLYLASSS